MMKIRHLLITAAVSVAALISASAYANHSWNNYHWARTADEMPLKVIDSVSGFWQSEFTTALSEWNQSSALDMSIDSTADDSRTRKRCSAVSGQMRVCNASYGFNGWLGLASINLDSNGHISRGTAKMNDSYSAYWADADEKRHVMCQEIGHVFGLGHTSEDGSSQQTCMDYSSDPESISPNAHDYQMLADIYAHTDSYNSYDDGSSSGGGGGCTGKKCSKGAAAVSEVDPPLGIPVHMGRDEEIWIANDGHGGFWIHHIRLVPDAWRNPSLHH